MTVLLVTSLVLVLATGLLTVVSITQLVVRNHREAVVLGHAAEASLALSVHLLEEMDWNLVLSGAVQAPLADGPPSGERTLEGGQRLDLDAETSRLNCGVPEGCTDAQMWSVTSARPWGTNNPRWRPFLYGPLSTLAPWRHPPAAYVIVWLGDDGREVDGNAEVDGTVGEGEGAGVLRVRALAVGEGGARQGVEAELVRACVPAWPGCPPGIRVQARRDLRQGLP